MASYELVFKRSVVKDLRAIPNRDVARIVACIERLRDDPRPPQSRKLSAQERYRLRLGRYRILYEIHDGRLIVTVIKVAHRREVYRS